MQSTSVTSVPRCLAVWLTVSAGAAGVVVLALPAAAAPPGPGFAAVLVRGCGVALLAVTGWWWTGSTLLLADAARRGGGRSPVGRMLPAPLRRGLLAACGLLVLGTPAAWAEPGPPATAERAAIGVLDRLDGLPFPQRPLGASTAGHRLHVVRPGQSLWSIARDALPASAGDARVAAYVHSLHAANRGVVGPDPDLVHPGQRLVLPPAP